MNSIFSGGRVVVSLVVSYLEAKEAALSLEFGKSGKLLLEGFKLLFVASHLFGILQADLLRDSLSVASSAHLLGELVLKIS